MFDRLNTILSKINFIFLFNVVIILMYISSQNYLEEDLIIGFCSNMILFLIIFFLKESKDSVLKEARLKVKVSFRNQKKYLRRYYFFFFKLLKVNIIYFKKIVFQYFLIKLMKLIIKTNVKKIHFFSKLVFIKLFYLNLLRLLFLNTLNFFLNF